MSRLQLLILWILALGAGFYYFNSKDVPDSISNKTELEVGSQIVPSDLIETVDSLTVISGDDKASLKKLDGRWVVSEKGDFPANYDSINQIIGALREAKVAQSVVATDEYYDRFNLDPATEEDGEQPDTILLEKDGKESSTIFLGKTRESTGGSGGRAGRFVRLSNDESGVYVVQESFSFLNASPDNWINKSLTPLKEGVVKMEVTAPNDESFKSWTVSRESVRDDFIVEGLGEKEETKSSETAALKNLLAGATFTELITSDDYKKRANEKAARQLKATDSTGTTFSITVTPEKKTEEKEEKKEDGSNPTPAPAVDYFVSIEILNGPTKPEPIAADASVQEKAVYAERVNNLADVSTGVNRMRKTYEGRYFLVSEATIGSLNKNRGELIQPKEEEKKPVSVATPPIRVPSPGDKAVNSPPLPGINTPPPSIARPKETQNKPKIEAVTPPIQVPPIPNKPKGEETTPEPVEPAESEKDSPAE
ncbi:MAG: DUF4340 domain-containing protein [Verrucomicrobiaceae bacterium]|nr:MAG: DUF4340 domain-containing protein [Verrucomicrobiaceae bacterium]HCN81625.1 hypothetical protein [Verrucomicrobiales bacterium]